MPDKLLELKNDMVFQEVFGKQKNSLITGHLISLIIGREIYNVDLDANKRMLGNRRNSKTGRLDVRAKFNDGEDCNIELQVVPYEYMPKRMLEYWAVMYGNKINSGADYSALRQSISILIADYKLDELKDIEEYHTVWNLREQTHPNKIITKDIELHILEIPKIKEDEVLKDELAQWLKFIENPGNREVEKFMSENKYLKQAKEELAYLSGEPDFQRLVEARAGFLKDQRTFEVCGEERGKREGKREGKKEEKIKIAKKLLAINMPIEQIIQVTELTKEEIENLKK